MRLAWLVSASFLLTSCAGGQPAPETVAPVAPDFQHQVNSEVRPWTHSNFDNDGQKFTFAVFSDLTGGEREGIFEVAVAQLNLLRPELILSVGDLIEGGTTDRARLETEWESFDRRAGVARAPVFYAGGNHDLTNPEMWDVWEERYGPRYYHFVYRNTLFLVLDTEDNTPEEQRQLSRIRDEAIAIIQEQGWDALPGTAYGQSIDRKYGRIGTEQAAYFRDVIRKFPDVIHTFVLLHKPAWKRPDEEPFASVEAELSGRPYTVFYGHEHDYFYEQRHGRDYIRLGTTGGVQNPAKEMAIDHVTLVTVTQDRVEIANLRMSGIFGKNGQIPAGGDQLCFEDCR